MIKKSLLPLTHIAKLSKLNIYKQSFIINQFATFMALFQTNKTKQQLSPVFKPLIHQKGHLRSASRKSFISPKLNLRTKKPKQKLKNHKGMMKRVKIVGPRWNRQFKFKSPHNYHLKRNKSTNNLKRKARARYISKQDLWRVKRLLPYFKRQAFKRNH